MFVTLLQVWLTNSQDDMTKKTLNLVLIAAFPLNTTTKKVHLLKLFIFPSYNRNIVEICFLTSKYFAENIFVNLLDVLYVKITFVFVAF